jgi:3-dehydroquinate synthetase
MNTAQNINYKINNNKYDIIYTKNIPKTIEKKINELQSDKKIVFIYDENINHEIIKDISVGLKLTGCKIVNKKIKSLKKNKNIKSVLNLISFFSENSLTKKSIVLVCGGGVIGDLAALASCLYKRGLIYINIPSTMTALVDSCIGGKTGINHQNQINLIGTYFHPSSVLIYDKIVSSIPEREYISGLAEVLKSFLLTKKNLNFFLINKSKILKRDKKIVKYLILQSLGIKINHFTKDVFENNKRLLLNFGHTFGHAFEMATDELIKKDFLRHGEAVALGIISEIVMSFLETKSISKKKKIYKNLEIVKNILNELSLPTKLTFSQNINSQELQKKIYFYVFKDKKRISEKPRYINFEDTGKLNAREVNNFDNINKVIYYLINKVDINII